MNTVKQNDIELWRQWKKTQSGTDLQRLLTQMNPIILREVNKWSNSMSKSYLESEGKRLAVEAFKSYDPGQGTALSTYLASRLPKLSRVTYSTMNVARLSETKSLLFHTYHTAKNELMERHGREPTNEELADHLAWSPKKLEQFQRQSGRSEFIESEEHPDSELAEDHLADFIYMDLSPLQKSIFEYLTGYQGKPKLSGAEIVKKLNITQGILSYQKSLIVSAIERAKAGTKAHGGH
jgi:DNA-directed RNA polymerase specialized sigma subunit